ncbi:MAG: DeoR/GlpR family DNA-binding transcription regulator [Roseburia sp.]|nr:DeoR/GlpR family DNA-binding transcription regulator [Roseburia sp.]
MDSMEQRRKLIVDFINEKGNITFAQLEKQFPAVSPMTLRTDLKSLDEAKKIVRIHGGAKSVEVVLGTDDYIGRRAVRNVAEKEKIVEKAVALIKPNTSVFLDSGSTTTALAKIWPDQPNFIFTNSMTCAVELSKLKHPAIVMLGGELNKYSMSVCGMQTAESVRSFNFDLAFLGVTSYASDAGFSCEVSMEAHLKQAVFKQAAEKIILMDSSKLDKKSTFHICRLEETDLVIADENVPEAFCAECEKAGVQLL